MICINCHQEFEKLEGKGKCPHCQTPSLLDERYELQKPLRRLSRLNPISVFLGYDTKKQEEVIIKALDYPDPEYQRHFQNEAAVLGNIKHSGLPIVDIDFGGYFHAETTSTTNPSVECFVMEKIPGVTLEEYIANEGRVSEAQAIQWLNELTEIIAALHEQKVFHRDIKPSNIIVRPDKRLALIDLGSVRQMTDTYFGKLGAGANPITQKCEVTVFASAAYTPYEQIQGRAVPQSDFYSLGRTMVYALTSQSPIKLQDDASGKLIWTHLAPQISPVLADYIDHLMALLYNDRPRNTDEIKAAIANLPNAIKRHKLKSSPIAKLAGLAGIGAMLWGGWYGLSWYLAERHINTGLSLALEGDYRSARSQLESALMYRPNSSKIHANLAAVCQQITSKSGQECAITHSQKALGKNKQANSLIYYNLGGLYEEMGDSAQAIEKYQLSLTQNAEFAPARNNLARLFIIAGQYAEAEKLMPVTFLEKQDTATRAVLLKNLGWLQYQQKQYPQAIITLKESIRLNPDEAASYCLMAKTIDAFKSGTSQNYWQDCLSGAATSPEVEQWQAEKLKLLFQKNPSVS